MPLGAVCGLCNTFTKTVSTTIEKPDKTGEMKQRKAQFIQRVEHELFLFYPLNLLSFGQKCFINDLLL